MAKTTRMIDVAEVAGVSLATVGRVLQGTGGKNVRVGEKTAEKVRRIANQMNYKPNLVARQLAGKKSKTLGLLIDPIPIFANSVRFAQISTRARQRGYHVLTLHEQPEPGLINECLDEFIGRGIDGLICMHHAYPGRQSLIPNLIFESSIRNVLFIDPPEMEDAYYVGLDFEYEGKQLVQYHYSKGRKRIALALSDLSWITGPKVFKGFLDAQKRLGLNFNNELIWIGSQKKKPTHILHTIDTNIANQIIDDLVVKNQADAIVTCSDHWAAKLILTLRERGYDVPGDVAVSGSGNEDFVSYMHPTLTSVDLKHQYISDIGVDMLIDMVEDTFEEDRDKGVLVRAEIISRESA